MTDKLTAKEARFVDEYLIDSNGTRAAIAAGYSPRSANPMAVDILAKPSVRKAIATRQVALRNKAQIKQEDVLREAALIAFSDIRNIATFSDLGVRFHDSNELTDEAARSIAEVSSKVTYRPGKRQDDEGINVEERKVKMYDKIAALKLVAQIIGAIGQGASVNVTNQNLTLPSGMTVEDLVRLRDELRTLAG